MRTIDLVIILLIADILLNINNNFKLNTIMAKSQERFDAIIARLDTITTDIAADYQKLLDEVRAGGVSDESFARAEANIATLEALGASVDNPVPEEPPVDPPVEG